MEKSNDEIDRELKLIKEWYLIQENLGEYLSSKRNELISRGEVFYALFISLSDKYELEWPTDLWSLEISYDDALGFIIDFDFNVLRSEIVVKKSLLPSEFVMNYKVLIKSKGLIWIIHKNDLDPFPSVPHAHQLDNNIKLDLSNGNCYKIRRYIYTIKRKDLLDIREKAKKVFKGQLPELSI